MQQKEPYPFRRAPNGYTVVYRKPDMSHVVYTPAQLAHRERFRQAVAYAQAVRADPARCALYEQAAARTFSSVFHVAVADFMHAPVIEAVDLTGYAGQPGDRVLVRARDDFEVASVQLRLLDAAEAEIEAGPAFQEPPGGGTWVYTAQSAVPPGRLVLFSVRAADRPGNLTTQLAEKPV